MTFGVAKVCHLLEPARSRTGRLVLVDIGLDPSTETPEIDAWDADRVADAWPWPARSSDKYAKGVVGVDAGSETYPGAGVMATYGAVHGGAGMVRFLGPGSARATITANLPNVVFAAGRVQAHLLGSGWGDRPDGGQVVADAVDAGRPGVLDADGLGPPPGTAARTPGSSPRTPASSPRCSGWSGPRSRTTRWPPSAPASQRTGATVLLKGSTQLVARPGATDGRARRPRAGLDRAGGFGRHPRRGCAPRCWRPAGPRTRRPCSPRRCRRSPRPPTRARSRRTSSRNAAPTSSAPGGRNVSRERRRGPRDRRRRRRGSGARHRPGDGERRHRPGRVPRERRRPRRPRRHGRH